MECAVKGGKLWLPMYKGSNLIQNVIFLKAGRGGDGVCCEGRGSCGYPCIERERIAREVS